jgi:hypothetical protein
VTVLPGQRRIRCETLERSGIRDLIIILGAGSKRERYAVIGVLLDAIRAQKEVMPPFHAKLHEVAKEIARDWYMPDSNSARGKCLTRQSAS